MSPLKGGRGMTRTTLMSWLSGLNKFDGPQYCLPVIKRFTGANVFRGSAGLRRLFAGPIGAQYSRGKRYEKNHLVLVARDFVSGISLSSV